MTEEDEKALDAEKAERVIKDTERMMSEWSKDKVRVYNNRYELWWQWNGSGYTKDITQAGLYDKSWKPGREEDVAVPVDPKKFMFDALMERLVSYGSW